MFLSELSSTGYLYAVCVSSEGSGETVWMCRPIIAFADCLSGVSVQYQNMPHYPQREWDILIASFHLSVCPLCYLLLNHWTKSNQIWCVSYSHEWGMQQHFFIPTPGALGRGQKVRY